MKLKIDFYCVDCPLHGKVVPLNGNCVNLEPYRGDINRKNVLGLEAGRNARYFEFESKCEYFGEAILDARIRIAEKIECSHKSG